jgi:hypothetical protein
MLKNKVRNAVVGLTLAATAGSGVMLATAGTAHAQMNTVYGCTTIIIEKGLFYDEVFDTIKRNCFKGEDPGHVAREYI